MGRDRPKKLQRHLTLVAGGRQAPVMNTPGDWVGVIDDYRLWMKAAALAEGTIKLKAYQLRRVAEAFPDGPWTVTADGVVAWIAGQEWGKASVASYRGMLSSFYKWAVITGRIRSSPVTILPPPPKPSLRARPAPDRVTKEALLSADVRVGLMIRLARRGGARRFEIARAHSDDLVAELAVDERGELVTESWLTIHGKGGKWRSVLLDQETVDAWHRWLDGRQGWVFPGAVNGHLAAATVEAVRPLDRHLVLARDGVAGGLPRGDGSLPGPLALCARRGGLGSPEASGPNRAGPDR